MSAEQQKTVTLSIDGREVSVPAGTLIIRAAESIGTYIPRFCDHPLLDPLGACRQCLVEVEGQRKPLTSCTTPVADGMVVRTQQTSDLAREGQEGVLEFLLINHPLDCPMCDKGGECPLQDQALAYGPGGSRYVDPKRRFTKPVPISPLIKLDRERCVLCARCTRFASQISGDPFIELFERGALEQVAIFEDEPYDSVFSGNVIQICPVGALTSSAFRFRARPFDIGTSSGVCNRCASGCSIDIQTRRGELVRILAKENRAVNDEWICDKGRFAYPYAQMPERVVEPLVRKAGEFVAVSWAEALSTVAEKIGAARKAGRRMGVLGGAQLVDEDSYALSRFARTVLGTNNVDFRRSTGGAEEDALLGAVVRSSPATNEDLDAAKLILVLGTDLREESPIVFLRVRKAARRGTAVIELGPRRTTANVAGARWMPCTVGAEGEALLAVARALGSATEVGLDPSTRDAAERSSAGGFEVLAQSLAAARGSFVVLTGDRLAASPGALSAAWNLCVALGGRFGWVPRKAGARGALWAGLHPKLLPGGRLVEDEADRAAVSEVWGTDVSEVWGTTTLRQPGMDVRAMLGAASELGLLYLVGTDPAGDMPSAKKGRALDAAAFVVAHDLFLTASSSRADIVLPACAVYEREGTLTNWEGRRQRVRAAVPSPGLAQTDAEILAGIAQVAGVPFPATPTALRREMTALDREPGDVRPIPVPAPSAPSGGGLALLTYPLLLDAGEMMKGADLLAQTARAPFVELHAGDAEAAGVAPGDEVVVRSDAGEYRAPARVTRDIARGTIFAPSLQATDREASALLPPDGGIARVRVEKAR